MYVLPVFIGTGNSMHIEVSLVYLFLISCVECLVICIDSFAEAQEETERKRINVFRDHFSCFVKIQEEILISYGKPQCVMFFLKFRGTVVTQVLSLYYGI
jgi:hypothetical protein